MTNDKILAVKREIRVLEDISSVYECDSFLIPGNVSGIQLAILTIAVYGRVVLNSAWWCTPVFQDWVPSSSTGSRGSSIGSHGPSTGSRRPALGPLVSALGSVVQHWVLSSSIGSRRPALGPIVPALGPVVPALGPVIQHWVPSSSIGPRPALNPIVPALGRQKQDVLRSEIKNRLRYRVRLCLKKES